MTTSSAVRRSGRTERVSLHGAEATHGPQGGRRLPGGGMAHVSSSPDFIAAGPVGTRRGPARPTQYPKVRWSADSPPPATPDSPRVIAETACASSGCGWWPGRHPFLTSRANRGQTGWTDTPTEREAESVWTSLRRRKVVQWGVAYAAAAAIMNGYGVCCAVRRRRPSRHVKSLRRLIGLGGCHRASGMSHCLRPMPR